MLEEVRITGLGVIDDAVLELSPGFTVVTGETGAGKTMVVTGLGLLFGGRADPARVRPGAERAVVEGRLTIDADGKVARQVEEAGGELETTARPWSSAARCRPRAVRGPTRAAARCRSSLLTYLADDLVAVHGQSDQQQLLRPGRQREALDAYAGAELAVVLADYQQAYQRHRDARAELTELTEQARERIAGGRRPAPGPERDRAADPAPDEDVELRAEEERLSNAEALRAAATAAHEALLGDPSAGAYERPDATALVGGARQELEAVRQHDPALAGLADRLSEASYLLADVAGELASYTEALDADPARLAAVQERRAGLSRWSGPTGRGPRPSWPPHLWPASPKMPPSSTRAGTWPRWWPGPSPPPPGCWSWKATTTGSPGWPRRKPSWPSGSPSWRASSARCARTRPSVSPPT